MTSLGSLSVERPKHQARRNASNCRCGGPCFFCGDRLPGYHEHDHLPIPFRHGGRETVPTCYRCHKLKEGGGYRKWSPASQEAARVGIPQGWPQMVVRAVTSGLDDPEYDLWVGRDGAWRAVSECTTPEARIYVAQLVALALDEALRRMRHDHRRRHHA